MTFHKLCSSRLKKFHLLKRLQMLKQTGCRNLTLMTWNFPALQFENIILIYWHIIFKNADSFDHLAVHSHSNTKFLQNRWRATEIVYQQKFQTLWPKSLYISGGLFQRLEEYADVTMGQKLFRIASRSEQSFDFRLQPEIFNFEINNSIEAEHFGTIVSKRLGNTFYGEHKTN